MWSRRRLIILVAVVVALVLLSPLIAGYFGPTAATYATTWRPWRSHLQVELSGQGPYYTRTNRVRTIASYSDPWPGAGRSSGAQIDYVTLSRPNVLLPWVVTERGTGP
jgi:hypothetical protein